MPGAGRVHDRALLDALEDLDSAAFSGAVWRVARKGRDPVRGSAAGGRWSPTGDFEVLYTSLEREGALAEIGFRLSLEPVWPSRMEHEIHRVEAELDRALRLADVAELASLGVDVARFASFDYASTQAVAAAAHFLEFDGLLVPSARHSSHNLVVFMDRPGAGQLTVTASDEVDWTSWRATQGRRRTSS